MKYGQKVKFFKEIQKRGRKTPLDDLPPYDYSYEWYMQVFSMLRSSRNENGVIPLSEILTYTKHFEIIGTKTEFVTVLQSLDDSETSYFRSKEKEESKKDEDQKKAPKGINKNKRKK